MTEIRREDFPDYFRKVVDLVGVDAAYGLCCEFDGQPAYIPKMETPRRKVRNRAIRAAFTGANVRELAERFGLSQRTIRRIVYPDRTANG